MHTQNVSLVTLMVKHIVSVSSSGGQVGVAKNTCLLYKLCGWSVVQVGQDLLILFANTWCHH